MTGYARYSENRAVISDGEEIMVGLFTRYYHLCKRGLMPPLLQEGCHLWTFSNPMDPWGSRHLLSAEDLARMCEDAERRDTRKPITSVAPRRAVRVA